MSASSSPRSVEYIAFVEIVHARWVRVEVEAPSPQAALAQIRNMKFQGRVALSRLSQITQYEQEGTE